MGCERKARQCQEHGNLSHHMRRPAALQTPMQRPTSAEKGSETSLSPCPPSPAWAPLPVPVRPGVKDLNYPAPSLTRAQLHAEPSEASRRASDEAHSNPEKQPHVSGQGWTGHRAQSFKGPSLGCSSQNTQNKETPFSVSHNAGVVSM